MEPQADKIAALLDTAQVLADIGAGYALIGSGRGGNSCWRPSGHAGYQSCRHVERVSQHGHRCDATAGA